MCALFAVPVGATHRAKAFAIGAAQRGDRFIQQQVFACQRRQVNLVVGWHQKLRIGHRAFVKGVEFSELGGHRQLELVQTPCAFSIRSTTECHLYHQPLRRASEPGCPTQVVYGKVIGEHHLANVEFNGAAVARIGLYQETDVNPQRVISFCHGLCGGEGGENRSLLSKNPLLSDFAKDSEKVDQIIIKIAEPVNNHPNLWQFGDA